MRAVRDDIDRLQLILDAIEEMWLRLPDDQLPLDAAEAKQDSKIGLHIVEAALKADGCRRMEATRRAMEAARGAREAATGRIPGDAAARRQLLESIVANDSTRLPERLTIAFRDGKELTDAEVESILSALDKLGFLKGRGETE
jgi:hypothetical protein